MNCTRRMSGFTLVELVTCIIILGVMAAFAAPKLLNNSGLDTRTYADEVAAALREAQAVAVTSGCEVALDLNATSYVAQQRSAASNQCNPSGAWSLPVLRADGTALTGSAPNNISVTPSTRIVFDARGHFISGAALINVGTHRISIAAGSGLVTLQ